MEMGLSEQLMYSTVRMECILTSGDTSVGTGFFYKFEGDDGKYIVGIITNKHVVKNAVTGRFLLTEADVDGEPLDTSHVTVLIDDFEKAWIPHPNEDIDLCVMPVSLIMHEIEKTNKRIFYRHLENWMIKTGDELDELSAIEDITMIGYPNGLWDSTNNKPVARKGVTATHPKFNYNGKEEVVIDAACFGGSSGSPVFILNEGAYATKTGFVAAHRIIFLGVLYAGPQMAVDGEIRVVDIPTSQRAFSRSMVMLNLGYIIKAHKIFDFEQVLKSMFKE